MILIKVSGLTRPYIVCITTQLISLVFCSTYILNSFTFGGKKYMGLDSKGNLWSTVDNDVGRRIGFI